jgi:hypothetical protein
MNSPDPERSEARFEDGDVVARVAVPRTDGIRGVVREGIGHVRDAAAQVLGQDRLTWRVGRDLAEDVEIVPGIDEATGIPVAQARATRSTVITSRKLPTWTTPDGVMPAPRRRSAAARDSPH